MFNIFLWIIFEGYRKSFCEVDESNIDFYNGSFNNELSSEAAAERCS